MNDYDKSVNDFMVKYGITNISIDHMHSYLHEWWYAWYCELLKGGYYSKNRKYSNCDDIVALSIFEYVK